MRWHQFSISTLLVLTLAVAVVLGMARLVPVPDLRAIDPVIWGGVAMVSAIGLVTAAGVWWFNS